MCSVESSQRSPIDSLFKTIFQVKVSYWLKALSPGRPEKPTCKAQSSQVLLSNAVTNGHLLSRLSVWSLCLQGDYNEHGRVFPSVTENGLFQTIFQVKLSYQLIEALYPRRPQQCMCRVSAPVSARNGHVWNITLPTPRPWFHFREF